MFKRVTWKIYSLGLVALMASCSYYSFIAEASPEKAVSMAESGVAVNVAKVTKANIPQTVDALGNLAASQKVTISAQDAGIVTALNFKSGQEVVQGMPIAQLDSARAKAEYQSAVTALQVIETKYRRSKLLLNTAISQQALDQLSADVEAAKAKVQTAQSLLDSKQVKAPFTGVLGTVKVEVGDYVNAGDPIVEIVSTRQLLVDYNIPEGELSQLKVGQLIAVSVDAYPKKQFLGTVNYISPIVSSDTRAVSVQATINNKAGLLSPGMYVHVKEQVSVTKNALVLPEEAVQADIKGYYVYLVKNHHAYRRYIKIGPRKGNLVQIAKGLALGDEVVSAGAQNLTDGSAVKILNHAS